VSKAKNTLIASTTFAAQAHVKFLSLEPLLGALHKLNLRGIDWAIVGGPSGPRARAMDPNGD
jgi:protein gp37